MRKNSVSEFELEKQDFKIRLKRGGNGGNPVVQYDEAPVVALPALPPTSPPGTTPVPPVVTPTTNEIEIKSPMIGTFYRAPSPESGNYVEVGTEVNADSVVCIIEAMKVMNEIKAEVEGHHYAGFVGKCQAGRVRPAAFQGATLLKHATGPEKHDWSWNKFPEYACSKKSW